MKIYPLAAVVALSLAAACNDGDNAQFESDPAGPTFAQPPPIRLGDPLPGLTTAELAAFERGRLVFERRFKPSEGLGPLYNATSCSSCHSKPVPGGSSDLYRNFYIAVWGITGIGFPLPGLPSVIVPSFGSGPHGSTTFTLEGGRHTIPPTVNGNQVTSAQRNSIPIFGTGLFEFVSNATILSNTDPDDADSDGVSGRVNNDFAGVGRFGLKAQSNNIELFTRGPLQNQMGITTDPLLGLGGTVSAAAAPQGGADPNLPTTDVDGVPDPEMGSQDLGDLIAFTRFLAPPQKKAFNLAASRGELLFSQFGCAKCHLPSLPSSRGPVEAYTDLLLHDMGPVLADKIPFGTPQAAMTSPSHTEDEFRTQPLWGVSKFAPYLHDGRAATLRDAIRLHGGEALRMRNAFLAASATDQADLITFLEKL